MDSQNEYLVIMKKHNRKIVERAYKNSIVNTNYKFPKNHINPSPQSQISESFSICSRVSETYDLHQQNSIPNLSYNIQRKIVPLSSIFKIKQKTNQNNINTQRLKTFISSNKAEDTLKLGKRQYLSLTPKKQSASKCKQSNIQRTAGINLTRRKQPNSTIQSPIEKNRQHQSESLICTLQKMTKRCFGNDSDHIQKENHEAIFISEKIVFTQQQMSKKAIKIRLSDKLTVDSTPLVRNEKTNSIKQSKHRRGMSILKSRQKVRISPFLV